MSVSEKIYSIDSSALISLEVFYPQRLFPKVWDALDALVSAKRLYVIDKVYDEVVTKDDVVGRWVKARRVNIKRKFPNNLMPKTYEIVRTFPKLIDYNNSREQADPYIVAEALISGAIVVTAEQAPTLPLDPKRKKEKLTTVCSHYSVAHLGNSTRGTQNEFAIKFFDELGLTDLG